MTLVRTDRYAPDFRVEIDNQPVDFLCKEVDLYVTSLKITETINQADSFAFTLAAHSRELASFPSERQLACLDDERFSEGHRVTIEMGYVGNLSLKFWGHITAANATFPEKGVPTLTVRGFSLYQQLQRMYRRKPFSAATDSGIAREIATEMKLKPDVDDTSVKHPIVSANAESYADILQKRANRINYDFTVKEDRLIFKKPTYLVDATPQLHLTWGEDLLRLQPHLSTYHMPTEVEVLSVQSGFGGDKVAIRGLCTAQELQPKLGKKSGLQQAKALGETHLLLEDALVTSAEEAKLVAQAYCRKRMLEFITAQGSSIGRPELRARLVVALQGIGERFSGNYYVTSTTHTIDLNGYRTDFEAKRDGR